MLQARGLGMACLASIRPLVGMRGGIVGVRGMGVVSPLNERRWASSEVEEVEEEGPVFDPTQGRLFKHQGEIPRLPIPDLEDTCERYLRSLEPLISDKEMLGETKEYVKEFLEGNGPSLQEELKRLDQENEKGSWVSGLWETMYLENRDPHPIHTSPFFVLSPFARMKDPLQVLAALIRSTASFHHLVRTGNLGPDMAGDKPLCSYQLPRFLASACIPGKGRDYYVSEPASNHITLNIQGTMFVFQVINDDGEIISQELCVKAIKKCFKDVARKEGGDGLETMIPVFTAGDRDTWAAVRAELSEANGSQLNVIDTSIAVFNLLEGEASTLEEASQIAMAPPLGWFDKLQFNVMQSGQVSLNMQHAACDGHTLLSLLRHIRSELVLGGGVGSGEMGRDNGPGGSQAEDEAFVKHAKPVMIEWELPGEIRGMMEKAQESFSELAQCLDAELIDFKVFGSDWIKSRKVSPDAFMQMAFQLAYYRMNDELVSTYESVMMKSFLRGRTETGRPVTKDMRQFVESMEDILLPPVKKAEMLRTASKAHTAQISGCSQGNGVDRHLWALNKLLGARQKRLDEVEPEKIFHDPSYNFFTHNIISTSTCAIEGVDVFGFGPVVTNGFGLGYAANPSNLMVYVTGFREEGGAGKDVNGYVKHVQKAFRDMYAILEEEGRVLGEGEGQE